MFFVQFITQMPGGTLDGLGHIVRREASDRQSFPYIHPHMLQGVFHKTQAADGSIAGTAGTGTIMAFFPFRA